MAGAEETPVPEGDGRVLEEGLREVTGTNRSLAACIADGTIPKPKILDWQDWMQWRKGAGMRPKLKLGDPVSTTLRHESVLWRSTMRQAYGEDWRTLLEEQQADQEDEEEADAESMAGGVRSTGVSEASAPTASGASAGPAANQQRLR